MAGTRRRWDVEALVPGAAIERLSEADKQGGLWRVRGDALPWPLFVRLGYDDHGEIVCTGLALGLDGTDRPSRVTAVSLRTVPLQEIIAEIVAKLREPERGREVATRAGGYAFYGDSPPQIAWKHLVAIAPRVGRVRPGRKGFSDDYLRELARDYQRAKKQHPESPTRALTRSRPKLPAPDGAMTDPSIESIRYQLRLAEERGFLSRPKRPASKWAKRRSR